MNLPTQATITFRRCRANMNCGIHTFSSVPGQTKWGGYPGLRIESVKRGEKVGEGRPAAAIS
jgi:hypothetical protein